MSVEQFGLEGALFGDEQRAALDNLLETGAAVVEVLVEDGGQAGRLGLCLFRGVLQLGAAGRVGRVRGVRKSYTL